MSRLAAGEPVHAERPRRACPEAGPLDLAHYFPCRVKGEVIAILGVGRKDGLDPLNSEEVDLLQALAGQAATAFMNGRLYRSLREKADELQELTEYNENILESIDSGILVLDLDGSVVRWNRAMEAPLRPARATRCSAAALDDVFPEAFLEALRGSLVLGRHEEIANIYKLHLPAADGRSLMVNVSVAPFQVGSGERCGTILILDDVTARMRLEEQLQHSEKMASIGLLAAGVAHEVNTPLTGISSYTQMLREQVEDDDPRAAAPGEDREADLPRGQDHQQPAELLALGRAREFEPLDVNKVAARRALAASSTSSTAARIKVRKELASDLPAGARQREPPAAGLLQPDPERPRRHAQRRLADAGHARRGRRGGGRGARHRPRHQARGHQAHLRSLLHHQGHRPRHRASASRSPTASCRSTAGAIFVDSVPGQGTTFQVALPALASRKRRQMSWPRR